MRTLSTALTLAQKQPELDAIWKIVLTLGATSYTYDKERILNISRITQDYTDVADVLLDNSDGALTDLALLGFQGIISIGLVLPDNSEEYSDTAPLWVIPQQLSSLESGLYCRLTLVGMFNLMNADEASEDFAPFISTLTWAANTDYVASEYVQPIIAKKDLVYRCFTEPGGTSGATEPEWPITPNQVVADGTLEWISEALEDEYTIAYTIKDYLNAIIGATLACFDHCVAYEVVYDSEDDIIDTFCPKDFFSIAKGSSRTTQIQKLMAWTNCVARIENDDGVGKVHISKPTISGDTWVVNTAYVENDYVQPSTPNNNFTYRCTTAGTSHVTDEPEWPTTAGETVEDGTVVWTAIGFDYEYELTETDITRHTFFAKSYRKELVMPNRTIVQSDPSHVPWYTGGATIQGYDELSDDMKKTHFAPYLRLASDEQATAIAKAKLAKLAMDSERGSGDVPINVGAELYDYIKITDAREDDCVIGNIGYLRVTCKPDTDASKGFLMQFGFGKLLEISALGITPVASALEGGAYNLQTAIQLTNQMNSRLQMVDNQIREIIDILDVISKWGIIGIPFIIHGAGAEIETGWKGHTFMPCNGEIVAAIIYADQVGDIVVDVWKCDLNNMPPTDADSITSTAPLSLVGAQGRYYDSNALASWTKTLAYLDCLAFNVDSVTDIEQVTIYLVLRKT